MDGTDYKKEQKDRRKMEEYDVIIEHHQSIGVVSSVKGEGNGNPLQYSCLENPMDGGAWWAAIHGVASERLHFHFPLSCIGEGNGNPQPTLA